MDLTLRLHSPAVPNILNDYIHISTLGHSHIISDGQIFELETGQIHHSYYNTVSSGKQDDLYYRTTSNIRREI